MASASMRALAKPAAREMTAPSASGDQATMRVPPLLDSARSSATAASRPSGTVNGTA
jgi:hypothetical protein